MTSQSSNSWSPSAGLNLPILSFPEPHLSSLYPDLLSMCRYQVRHTDDHHLVHRQEYHFLTHHTTHHFQFRPIDYVDQFRHSIHHSPVPV